MAATRASEVVHDGKPIQSLPIPKSQDGQGLKTAKAGHVVRSLWLLVLLIITVASLARLHLLTAKSDLTYTLQRRLELSDPFTSWKAVRKASQGLHSRPNAKLSPLFGSAQLPSLSGQALLDGGISEHGVTKRAVPTPLLLILLTPLLSPGENSGTHDSPWLESSDLLFVLMDAISALCIFRIATLRLWSPIAVTTATSRQIRPRLAARHLLNSLGVRSLRFSPSPVWASAIYALNPLTTLTCAAKSGTTISSTFVLLSVWAAMEGLSLVSAIAISLACGISFYPVLVLPAILLLCVSQSRYWSHHRGRRIGKRKQDTKLDWVLPIVYTTSCLTAIAAVSASFIAKTNGTRPASGSGYDWYSLVEIYSRFLLLPSLTPSLSLWWYFFVEIFDHFRGFFLLVFNAHVVIWTIPVCVRFRHDPLYAVFLLLGVQSIFKAYPTAGDVSLYVSLSTLFTAQASYLRTPLPTVLLYAYSAFLIPSFGHLFLTLGSANANFLYAVGLVGSLGGIMGWIDWAWAGGRYLWELEREAGLDEQSEEDRIERESVTSSQEKGVRYTRTVVQL
ncbi:unnamed protein product [Sympodiomycopsis kandeliae]